MTPPNSSVTSNTSPKQLQRLRAGRTRERRTDKRFLFTRNESALVSAWLSGIDTAAGKQVNLIKLGYETMGNKFQGLLLIISDCPSHEKHWERSEQLASNPRSDISGGTNALRGDLQP